MAASDYLSQSQLQGLADIMNAGGGFSVKAVGEDAGKYAENSFMVGVPGHGRDFPVGDTKASDLGQFISDKEDILREPPMYMGGWRGGDPARGSVDVAKAFPRTSWDSVIAAKAAAIRGNQEAIGAVGTRESGTAYQGDIKNPYYTAGAGHAGREVQPHELAWVHSPVATIIRGDKDGHTQKTSLVQRGGKHAPMVFRPASEPKGKMGNETFKRTGKRQKRLESESAPY